MGAMRVLAMASVALAAAACGVQVPFVGDDESQAQDGRAAAAFAEEAPEEIIVQALSARRLSDNECGLFLWSRGADARLVFYSSNNTGVAQIKLADDELQLPRLSTSGNRFAGQFTEQTFRTIDGALTLSLSVERGRAISDGVRVPNGTMRLSHQSGWESVVPVAGLVGCQPPT